MTTEQAKCLALIQLLKHYGEDRLLQNLQTITVSTKCTDHHVYVHFRNEAEGENAFSFQVCIHLETGKSITVGQP